MNRPMSELWVALQRLNDNGEESIVFHVLDEDTGDVRAERRDVGIFPEPMALQELPWRFRTYEGKQMYSDNAAIGWLANENGNGKEKA
jgi:hypothetical protein